MIRKNLIDFGIGLAAVALLIFVKGQVEDSRTGRWFNVRGYEILHSFLTTYNPDEELPVIVLDISDLRRDPDGTTPTESLRKIIEALAESGAKAIAIDIDFSPRIELNPLRVGLRSETDEQFFEFLHEQKRRGLPVFVGAYNIGTEPKTWLGTDKNKDLAADMTLFDKGSDSTEVRASLQCGENAKLYNISKALAEIYGIHPRPPRWLRATLVDYEDRENLRQIFLLDKSNREVVCQRAYTLVNYGKLELIQKLTLQTLDRDSIVGARDVNGKSRFQGKLVFIGNGQRDKTTDSFVVIGRSDPVFGVYIHAVAAYTLVADPVHRFKHSFSILLDALLGMLIVTGLFMVRWLGGTRLSPHLWESLFILIAILVVLLLGFLMVRVYNILWLDFTLVILSILLHSKVQNGLSYPLRKLFNAHIVIRKGQHP